MSLHNDIKVVSNTVLEKLFWNSYRDERNKRGKISVIRNEIMSLRVTSLVQLL